MIGACGDMRSPPEGARPPSVIHAPRREHSRKPDEAYEIIERMYPTLPKIELFARQTRPGWEVWGNQVGTGRIGSRPDVLRSEEGRRALHSARRPQPHGK
jgi:N6-adenosine-specific RNA methylase IME4